MKRLFLLALVLLATVFGLSAPGHLPKGGPPPSLTVALKAPVAVVAPAAPKAIAKATPSFTATPAYRAPNLAPVVRSGLGARAPPYAGDTTTWVVESNWVTASSAIALGSRTTTSPWTAQQTVSDPNGKSWTDQDGCWGITGGYLLTYTVSNGGSSYSSAPTVTVPSANDSTAMRKVTATATATVAGNAVTAVAPNTNLGRGYATNPTLSFSGGGGTGAAGTGTASGNILQCVAGSVATTSLGSHGWLTRPATLTQRVVAKARMTASTDQFAVILRGSRTSSTLAKCYSFVATGTKIQIFKFSDYDGSTGATTILNQNYDGAVTVPVGSQIQIDARAVGSSPTTLWVKVTNLTNSTTLYDNTTGAGFSRSAAADPSTWQSAGVHGLGLIANLSSFDQVTTYVPEGFAPTPATTGLNQNSLVLTLSGQNTAWLSTTPTFTLTNTGSTNASKVSQTIVDDTTATLTINTGSVAGNVTLGDPSISATSTLVLQAITVPTASVSTYGNVVSASGPVTFGNAPFTVQLWRSPNANFGSLTTADPTTDTGAVKISEQTGVAADATPTSYTDSSPPGGTVFYIWRAIDASSQAGVGAIAARSAPVANAVDPPPVMFIGDSITVGHASTVIHWVTSLAVTNGGSGYHQSTTTLTISGGGGSGATAACEVVGGVIVRAWVTNPGWGYEDENTLPTVSIVDSDGSPGTGATITAAVGGGMPYLVKESVQSRKGFKGLRVANCAVGGTATSGWAPHSVSNTTYLLENAKSVASLWSDWTRTIWVIRLGANDANGSVSAASYETKIQSTITQLRADGFRGPIILLPPIYWPAGGDVANRLLQLYAAKCLALSRANTNVQYSADDQFSAWVNSPTSLFSDQLHPNAQGTGMMAAQVLDMLAPYVGLRDAGGNNGNGLLVSAPWRPSVNPARRRLTTAASGAIRSSPALAEHFAPVSLDLLLRDDPVPADLAGVHRAP